MEVSQLKWQYLQFCYIDIASYFSVYNVRLGLNGIWSHHLLSLSIAKRRILIFFCGCLLFYSLTIVPTLSTFSDFELFVNIYLSAEDCSSSILGLFALPTFVDYEGEGFRAYTAKSIPSVYLKRGKFSPINVTSIFLVYIFVNLFFHCLPTWHTCADC